MNSRTIAVGYEGAEQLPKALELADRLELVIDNHAEQQLLVTSGKLLLKIHPFLPIEADFSIKFWQHRRDAGKKQGLVKACKPKPGLTVVDATAGWGRDAAVLASFGAQVIMLERDPIMAVLLEDALQRRDERSELALNLSLYNQDAKDYLRGLSAEKYPDVVYIDPMHPARQKAALVKKDLQILQHLVGADEGACELMELARTRVLQKVVVKWPQQQPPLLTPDMSIPGKTVRFDIYRA